MSVSGPAPNFWMREDNQLRFEQTAAKLEAALAVADTLDGRIPDAYAGTFRENVKELRGLRRRVLAYAYHLRETNLADLLRGRSRREPTVATTTHTASASGWPAAA